MRTFLSLVAAVGMFLPAAALAQDANDPLLERGFHADGVYQSLDIDHVDVFRTSVEVGIPIGQPFVVGDGFSYAFALSWHSDVWDLITQDACPESDAPCWWTTAVPNRGSNAGLSFQFHLGRLIDPAESVQFHPRWAYVSKDGAEHEFHRTLHLQEQEDTDPNYDWYYTRDGSYTRMYKNSSLAVVETPDGNKHTFVCYDFANHLWRLSSIEDRFGNSVWVTYDVDGQSRPRWTITDGVGRTHTVLFDAQHKHVVSVDLAAFGGARAIYSFAYQFPKFHRSFLDTDTASSEYLNVPPAVPGSANTAPFLVSVTLPDLSTWKMTEGSTSTYYVCADGGACSAGSASGALKRLYGPAGGGIEWTWADRSYEWEQPFSFQGHWTGRPQYLLWAGVATRKLIDASGATISGSQWQYESDFTPSWSPGTTAGDNPYCGVRPEERWTIVSAPDGNDTVHYFRSYPGSTAMNGHQGEYGLPFTTQVTDPLSVGRYLSTLHFQGDVTVDDYGDVCPSGQTHVGGAPDYYVTCDSIKPPLRTVYRSYQLDELDDNGGHRHANRHLVSERTLYEDSKWASVTNSDPDGAGHFRLSATDGNYGSGNVRTSFTNYNPSLGSYPPASWPAEWWPRTSPWVLNTYTETRTTADSGTEARTSKTEACFSSTTGSLLRTRSLKETGSGGAVPSPHQNDVVVRFTRTDTYPYDHMTVLSEETFGGDTGSVGTTALCALTLSSANSVYRIDKVFRFGSLESSRYMNTDGTGFSSYLIDRDIDDDTGLPYASHSASGGVKGEGTYDAGIVTSYVYDTMGRL